MDSINNIIKKLRENRILNERKDYNSYSRDELIELAQEGDQLAIETLINNHQGFIKKMSSKYFLDSGDKDDVEQLATIGFWEAINSYNPAKNGDFEAYAGMIIKRKLTDELRKDSAEKVKINTNSSSLDEPIAGDEDGQSSVGDTIASKGLSPEEEYLGRAGAAEIEDFMKNKLSDDERLAIDMRIKGYSISEIAEETGMNYKKVENAVKRVKDKLAAYLRARESKKIRENKELDFTDDEKKVLESVLQKIKEGEEGEDEEGYVRHSDHRVERL